MKSSSAIWFLVVVAASIGLHEVAAQQENKPKPAPKHAIGVGKGIQHWLFIYSDGSGTVGYGAGGGKSQGYFKAGTFDVKQVTKQLKGLAIDEKGGVETHHYFYFESEQKGPDQPVPPYFTTDRKLIPSLFAKAYKASGM